MDERDWLADKFEENRPHLRAVAYRMLGSATEADDAVQESWIRLDRSQTEDIENLSGWLTTVVARVCLDMLRARRAKGEMPIEDERIVAPNPDGADPEHEAMLADSVGLALLIVLDSLSPTERIAFVLHDMFGVPFDDIGLITDKSPAAARQIASRARRKVRSASSGESAQSVDANREIVEAFLAASRAGNFERLVSLLDPEATVRADSAAVSMGAAARIVGARAVAERFSGHAKAAVLTLIDNQVGATWFSHGNPKVLFAFSIDEGKIRQIDLIADEQLLDRATVTVLKKSAGC